MKLQIEKMVYGGAGLAHPIQDDRTIFVPFTLPGEMVETSLAENKNGHTEASLLQILTPSEFRVEPGCAHFGECGGCHYQHAAYSAQVDIKAAILRDTLERAGLSALPEIQAHAAEPWKYRNRTRLRIELHDGAPGGVPRVGYNRRSSNQFLPIRECPISAPLIWRAAEALLVIAAEDTPAGRWAQSAAEVEFFVTGDEKKLQMTVFVKSHRAGFSAFCDRMQELLPELTGAGTALLPTGGTQRRAQKARPLSSWGAPGLIYPAAGEEYWVSRGGFFQVNRFLLDQLVAIVTTGRKGFVAWDLYAGVGLFSRALARSFARVVAVEVSAHDLIHTFKGAGRHAIAATTLEFLQSAVLQRERPEWIVLDPPRAGLGEQVCALLARVSAPGMVYVSCDPVTLARDLKILVEAGYRVFELHMVDLFPQTFHLETVVVLRR